MNEIYLIIVIVLMALAVSDLIVGVSNDAVNFLNSAIGSKVASFRTIMLVASAGIILGAMFSNGMMEVARKGVFYPENFSFAEIMVLFFAVMITDILLLDFFNTIGLPTSTTVSIVFELLGSAVAVAVVKIAGMGGEYSTLGKYINSANALLIISGILISIAVAFTVGSVIQFLSRLLFTFNFQKKLKYLGAIWGGLAVAFILYFIIVKGVKGSIIIPKETVKYIEAHSLPILLAGFVVLSVIMQLLQSLFKINSLKVVVLFGTFGLAMAFAGNDLVNFIGVPLAGLSSYKAYIASGLQPDEMMMGILKGEVKTEPFLLLIAGLVMVATLWLSKKARTVTDTEVSLGRQDSGYEKFGSSLLARSIVRQAIGMNSFYTSLIPASVIRWTNKRFENPHSATLRLRSKDEPAFDLVRASVNLTVSSILIAFATSLKLPLSTTYVTFMVAMGTSLSDRAWGRESAVYRVTGVLTVIGGWFITAFVAFTVSLLIALIVSYAGIYAIIGFILLTILFIFRTQHVHRRKVAATSEAHKVAEAFINTSGDEVIVKCNDNVSEILLLADEILSQSIDGLFAENRKMLRQAKLSVKTITEKAKRVKTAIPVTIRVLEQNNIDTGHKYIQLVDYAREISRSVRTICDHAAEHVENNHEPITGVAIEEIRSVNAEMRAILRDIAGSNVSDGLEDIDPIKARQAELDEKINALSQLQVVRMSMEKVNSRSALLYMNLMFEFGNLVSDSVHLLKAKRVFNWRAV